MRMLHSIGHLNGSADEILPTWLSTQAFMLWEGLPDVVTKANSWLWGLSSIEMFHWRMFHFVVDCGEPLMGIKWWLETTEYREMCIFAAVLHRFCKKLWLMAAAQVQYMITSSRERLKQEENSVRMHSPLRISPWNINASQLQRF